MVQQKNKKNKEHHALRKKNNKTQSHKRYLRYLNNIKQSTNFKMSNHSAGQHPQNSLKITFQNLLNAFKYIELCYIHDIKFITKKKADSDLIIKKR